MSDRMGKKVHIVGERDVFFDAISDRLTRAGAIFTEDRENADVVVSLGKGSSGDVVVVPGDAEAGDASLIVRIHDLLIPESSSEWGPMDIHEWSYRIMEGVNENEVSGIRARHWLHVRDATDALSLLIMADSDVMPKGILDMSGRRAWGPQEVLEEMSLLWSRFTNALNHSHTPKSLSAIPSPVPESSRGSVRRPELGPLHEALRELGTDGWHPLVPMRVALMEVFAHAEN